MEEQVWTLIAILAATLLVLFQVGLRSDSVSTRIDALRDNLDTKFDRIHSRFERIDTRFEHIESRFDRIDSKFEHIESKFGQVDRRFDAVETGLRSLQGQGSEMADAIYPVAQKLDDHLRRHAS